MVKPLPRGPQGPRRYPGQNQAQQKRNQAMQDVKDAETSRQTREAYERFMKTPEADTIEMNRGGKVKKMARGGMTDEERYGKVGAEIRRLDPEAYKSRSDKSAEANLKLLRELREKSRGTRKMDTKEFIEKYEESDTPAGRPAASAARPAPPRGIGGEAFKGSRDIKRMMGGDDDESPAMKRIRIARELAKSKGPSTRYTPVKAEREGMSMAQRRMREAGRMNMGGSVKKYAKGGVTYSEGGSISKRADGIAKKGRTRCKMV